MGRPSSQYLRDLEAAVEAQLLEEMGVALRVGVLLAAGLRQGQIVERLAITVQEFRRAQELLRRATPRLPRAREMLAHSPD